MNFKQIVIPPIILSVVFFLFYFRMKGMSGGDLFVGLITSILLVAMILIIGMITFSWKWKDKLGYLMGLLITCLLFALYSWTLL